MPNTVAALLINHVDDWVDLVDINRPGVGAQVDAVLSGTAGTESLPVDVALRLIDTVERPADVAANDQRTKVRARLAERGGHIEQPRIPSAATKLFDGDTDTIIGRIATRRGRLGSAHAEVWAQLDIDTRRAVAPLLLAKIDGDGAAAVIGQLADDQALNDVLAAAYDAIREHHDVAAKASVARDQIRAGIAGNLAAWLRDHSDGGTVSLDIVSPHYDGAHTEPRPDRRSIEAGRELGAAAGRVNLRFSGPVELGACALAAVRPRPLSERSLISARQQMLLFTGVDCGMDWATIRREILDHDGALPTTAVDQLSQLLTARPTEQRRAAAADILRTEMTMNREGGPHIGAPYTLHGALAELGGHLDDTERLHIIVQRCTPVGAGTTRAYWVGPTLRTLSPMSRDAVAAVAAEHHDIAAFLDQLALDWLGSIGQRHLSGEQFDIDGTGISYVVERQVAIAAVTDILAHTAKHPHLAAAWAHHCEQLLAERRPGDRQAAWVALCQLADGFAGTTSELVDVAIATSN
jgi:hypothetical protein